MEPVLLAAKACANFMRRNSRFRVAGAGPKEYEYDDGSMDLQNCKPPIPEIFYPQAQGLCDTDVSRKEEEFVRAKDM